MLLPVVAEGDIGRVAVGIVDCHILGLVEHRRIDAVQRLIQILRDLGLAIDHHRFAGELLEVDMDRGAMGGDDGAIMDESFAVHALAHPGLAQDVAQALLQNAGPDTRQNVVARAALQHDSIHARPAQQQ